MNSWIELLWLLPPPWCYGKKESADSNVYRKINRWLGFLLIWAGIVLFFTSILASLF